MENEKYKLLKRSKVDKLMDAIVSLVEAHNCQMAGNYRALTEEEKSEDSRIFYPIKFKINKK